MKAIYKLRKHRDAARQLLLLFIMFCVAPSFAQQDNHLSQFSASPMLLNPAMTGMFDGNHRTHMHYRNQWKSLTKNSFVTQNVGFDMPKNKFGYGAYILNNKAGIGNLQTLTCLLSAAYEVSKKEPGDYHHLTTGVQIGFINKSINFSNLTFDNQYSSSSGGSFDPNISNQEVFQNNSNFMPDINLGVYYYNTNKESKFNPYAGISGFHLTSPNESFFGEKKKLPVRYGLHGGSKIKINEHINIEPSFLFMRQKNVNDINVGIAGYYFIPASRAHFMLGTFYRNKDAVIVHTGFLYKEYTLRMSYDINISKLSAFSRGRGGFEISVTYTRKRSEYMPSIN